MVYKSFDKNTYIILFKKGEKIMTKKFGFTLAEVLITLGIIGVVAAMTMPTLLNSTNGAQYRTAYKKALSVLSQAVVLNVALDDYDLSQATTASDTDKSKPSLYALFNNRMNVVKTAETGNWVGVSSGSGESAVTASGGSPANLSGTANYTLFFNDGITFSFPKGSKACTEAAPCKGVIDINGEKNPNKQVACDSTTGECKVTNPTDIYPVVMYDQSVLPATAAGRAVLYGGK